MYTANIQVTIYIPAKFERDSMKNDREIGWRRWWERRKIKSKKEKTLQQQEGLPTMSVDLNNYFNPYENYKFQLNVRYVHKISMKIWNWNIHIHIHLDGWNRKLVWFEQIFVHILIIIFPIFSRIYDFHIGFIIEFIISAVKSVKYVTVKNRREVVYSKTKMV